MYNCSNCSTPFDDHTDALVITQRGLFVTAICTQCINDVRVAKLVLRRSDVDAPFAYEQYLPVETVKKAFGK